MHTSAVEQEGLKSLSPWPFVATPSVLIVGLQTSAHSEKQVRHL